MKQNVSIIGAILGAALASCAAQAHQADDPLTRPIAPDYAQRWLTPLPPAHVHGNTYFVGFAGLGVALIRTSDGLILLDGAVPQAVRDVEANIRRLGFRVEDIRYILTTEPHWDHVGGVAALARDSGAIVVAGAPAAEVFRTGRVGSDDPQSAHLTPFPAVANVRAMADGEMLRLGDTTVTARATPGHTAGSMSWSWRSCEGARCLDVVFGASLNAVSADGYRFSDPAHRTVVESFRSSFAAMRALPCDILITSHPDQFGLDARYRRFQAGEQPNPLIDPNACRAYADRAEQRLDARLATEAGQAASPGS
ncbi:subclass B3 metallo-beta-lactamase [Sphingosinicella sp. LHD-64]|uniref:subclass B3 metallo-beta-lactamase n=1 Tax=Sphingosinicella sp. LHD-64 TaxID=3072139 RepID=UPI00280E6C4C|nr:subclass B3 metallo-beta-lactamase [Sphingosinicella sp. LHD-64]MDQ8756276.1 subclass B3 metallo-beta-lactamase [Sphingosinicella sp. LHD-64]